MSTQILHVSDTHLGNRQYGSDVRRDDFADAFAQAIEYAVNKDVDAVIHTGDLFDSRDPGLRDLNQCIDILQHLETADIPFYGIVGNHERKMDTQYLDLINKTGTAERLDRTPTVINDEVAIYGIDAVTKPAWHAEEFDLTPAEDAEFSLLCMHQLLTPPVPELFAEHPLEDVLNRVAIDLKGLALGDYHEPVETTQSGTKAWYAGSTERCSTDEEDPRTVSLLEIDGQDLSRRQKELETRDFVDVEITFTEGDSFDYVEDVIDRYDVDGKVVTVTLEGESTAVTSRDVRELTMRRGAAVCRVDDTRGGPDIDLEDGPTGEVESADRLIEDRLSEHDLSLIAAQVEQDARTGDGSAHGYADAIEERVETAQAEAFGEQPHGDGQEDNA